MILPWRGNDVPHATLDVLRGCNAACRSCYNREVRRLRPLADLERDLDQLLRLRRLHTVTITGGEPTLHPELPGIVAAVRRRGLRACVITNGIAFDAALAATLAGAGLDMVLLHIQAGQVRPDVDGTDAAAVSALRRAKAALAAAHGIEAAYSLTVQPDEAGEREFAGIFDELLSSPDAHFMLLTPAADLAGLGPLRGSLADGMVREAGAGGDQERVNAWLRALLARLALRPFAWLPSSHGADPRWLSYTLAGTRCVPAGPADWLLLRLARLLAGRYGFYYPSHPGRFSAQLLLNALCLHRPLLRLGVLAGALRRGRLPRDKHLLVELLPTVDAAGRIVVCRDCPDATLRDGRLVPVCLGDLIAPPAASRPAAAAPVA